MDFYRCKCWSWDEIIGFLCRRIIETIFARPAWGCVYSDWMENWKLEKVMTRDSRRTRCTKYFQICWDATELQRAASSTLQKKNNQSARKTVNLAKVQFAEKVKVKNDSLSGEMCPWSFKSIQRSATKSSHFLSAFCPFLQFGPNRIFWYRVTLS